MANIITPAYSWRNLERNNNHPVGLVLHHRAGDGDVASLHALHLKRDNNTWAGIGYHYYIRKDGTIFKGRPDDSNGCHTPTMNYKSLGICFEGNYETESSMPAAQFNAGVELLRDLLEKNPSFWVKKHRDITATACPGKYFPFEAMVSKAKEKPKAPESGELYRVQVGAYAVKENAEKMRDKLKAAGFDAIIV